MVTFRFLAEKNTYYRSISTVSISYYSQQIIEHLLRNIMKAIEKGNDCIDIRVERFFYQNAVNRIAIDNIIPNIK